MIDHKRSISEMYLALFVFSVFSVTLWLVL